MLCDTGHYGECDIGRYRVTIQEAAQRLGVKEAAVRKRIERGTLKKEKASDGRVYVFIDEPPPADHASRDVSDDTSYPTGYDVLIRSQERQIEFLQRELENRTEELRRRDVIISQLTQRIPELEPNRQQEAPSDAAEEAERVEPRPAAGGAQEGAQPRPSWWRRMFRG